MGLHLPSPSRLNSESKGTNILQYLYYVVNKSCLLYRLSSRLLGLAVSIAVKRKLLAYVSALPIQI